MRLWAQRISALLAPVAATVALLAALGVFASDVPATNDTAHARALSYAVELRHLADRTVDLGRTVQLSGDDAARRRLRAVARRGRSIEHAVRQLDQAETSRGELRRAALSLAESAAVLARLRARDGNRPRRARRALRDTQRSLRKAAGELEDTAPRGSLAQVRRRIPAVLVAGPRQR